MAGERGDREPRPDLPSAPPFGPGADSAAAPRADEPDQGTARAGMEPGSPMTGTAPARVPLPGQAADPLAPAHGGTYSKDYWDTVFEQIARRPMVKAALAMLAILYGLAIYAPLLASDRPYVLEAVDYREYSGYLRSLTGVVSSVRGLAEKGEEGYRAALADEAQIREYGAALDAERGALALRLDTMRGYLPAERHARLDALQAEIDRAIELAKAGDSAQAVEVAGTARTEARELRADYAARLPGEEAPEQGGVELQGVRSYPLAEATTWLEVFFIVLWALVLSWPVWNRLVNRRLLGRDRTRIRRARRAKIAAVLGLAAGAALVWHFAVGGSMAFESATYKARLTSGEIVATRALFPPLAMGFAEPQSAEIFRPPTWRDDAELDERGHYVRGPRVPVADPITGHVPPPTPVNVRFAEPELNSPWRHLLGTDSLGRDLLVRLIWGARISLAIGILSTVLLVAIGVVIGACAGYFGGWVDVVISRVIEIFQSFPAFFLILTAVSVIPEDVLHPIFAIVLLIAVVRWTGVARLVRGEFLKLKEQDFVLAARTLGFSAPRVIFRHVLPNALGPVLVAAAFSVAAGILTESAISFLGLGVKLPIPSWGSLINDTRIAEYWWIQIFPGLLIFVTVFCYNVVGEGLRDALDPRMKV